MDNRSNDLSTTKNKILQAAKALFLEYGYDYTTIQRIVKKSGVRSGSIYHWYKGKEEIFQVLVDQLMQEAEVKIAAEVKNMPKIYCYVLLLSLEMETIDKNPIIRGMYRATLASEAMFEKLVNRHTRYLFKLFEGQFSYNECLQKTIVTCGAMNGYILSLDYVVERTELREIYLDSALKMYNIPQDNIHFFIQALNLDHDIILRIEKNLLDDFVGGSCTA